MGRGRSGRGIVLEYYSLGQPWAYFGREGRGAGRGFGRRDFTTGS